MCSGDGCRRGEALGAMRGVVEVMEVVEGMVVMSGTVSFIIKVQSLGWKFGASRNNSTDCEERERLFDGEGGSLGCDGDAARTLVFGEVSTKPCILFFAEVICSSCFDEIGASGSVG